MEVEYQPATIETLLLSDSLLASSGCGPPPSLVFPHPPSLPHPSSLSPRAIAQTTVTELSQLEWEGSGYPAPGPASYHQEYQELESGGAPGSPGQSRQDILESALVLNNIEIIDDISYSREEDYKDESMER